MVYLFDSCHRTRDTEELRIWPVEAVAMPCQPCHLCDAGFEDRASLPQHISKEHGGLQKCRNAMLCLKSLCPHVVVGSEVDTMSATTALFSGTPTKDWEPQFVTELRGGRGCAFCARWFWLEEMWPVPLAGEQCFNMFGAGNVVHVFGICIKLREDVNHTFQNKPLVCAYCVILLYPFDKLT